ncbi:MAG: capsule assembly Wzi family protein, partial [Proteobacteria bacterium]|nr:capsule assembly Wzi family protein [Pseudomonadota bacterium]
MDLNVQYVDSDQDDDEVRYDDSMVGVVLGNYSVAVSTMQRWWGPGWDGSLILSNNARPIPSLTIDRVFTDAFETKWLSWLGPWDLNIMFGQMEKERHVPNTKFFGMRFNFRPIPSLEIGLARTAQWCGDGRPCDFETFVDLWLGNDNRGSDGLDESTEPGNQLAGFDVRWSPSFFGFPVAVYGQLTGEDEAGGFPSRYLAQGGFEVSGYLRNKWSYRLFAELAGTSCDFVSDDIFNCAYNHSIYQTGYRYRGRVVGHGADNDARLVSTGWLMVDENDKQWRVLLRFGELNRGGSPDSANSLTPTPQDIASIDLSHSRVFPFGVIDLGIGYEQIDDAASGDSTNNGRAYLQWRSSY